MSVLLDGGLSWREVARIGEGETLVLSDRATARLARARAIVEAIVTADPRVAEAAAVAMPDPDLGERLCLFVVPASADEPVGLAEVVEIVKAADVAKFKWPERLEVVPALPRNPVGKVLKRELREQLRASDSTGGR